MPAESQCLGDYPSGDNFEMLFLDVDEAPPPQPRFACRVSSYFFETFQQKLAPPYGPFGKPCARLLWIVCWQLVRALLFVIHAFQMLSLDLFAAALTASLPLLPISLSVLPPVE